MIGHPLVRIPLLLCALSLCASAQNTPAVQQDPPMTLMEVNQFLGDTTLAAGDIPLLLQAVERNGIDFQVDQAAIAQILEAGRRGKRSDQVVASLVLQVLRACSDCRSRYYGPLSEDELLSLVRRKIPARVLVDEVGLRGTRNVPANQATLQKLVAAGAPAALIDLVVPDDMLEVATPEGYTRLSLSRMDGYNRSGAGLLKFKLDVIGKVELVFVNNALFYRSLPNSDKKMPEGKAVDQGSSFRAPAPAAMGNFTIESATRSEDKGKVTTLVDNGKALSVKGVVVPTIEFASNLTSGRNGFRIIIDERDKKQAHTYELRVSWAAGAPKQ